jgi:hypothetical protein
VAPDLGLGQSAHFVQKFGDPASNFSLQQRHHRCTFIWRRLGAPSKALSDTTWFGPSMQPQRSTPNGYVMARLISNSRSSQQFRILERTRGGNAISGSSTRGKVPR